MTAFSSMRLLGSEGSGSQAHEPEMQEEACEAQGTQTRTCLRRSGTHKELGALNSTGAAAPSSLPRSATWGASPAPCPPCPPAAPLQRVLCRGCCGLGVTGVSVRGSLSQQQTVLKREWGRSH